MAFSEMSYNLFARYKYTLDTCSFHALLQPGRAYSRDRFLPLWNEFEKAFAAGLIISHAEVYKEIVQVKEFKDELAWIRKHKEVFVDYDLVREPTIITEIGSLFPSFVHQYKRHPRNADPWLVAQAKANKLTVVTEETGKDTQIPVVCRKMGVPCISVRQVIDQENWTV